MLRIINKTIAFVSMSLIGWFVIGVPIMMLVLPSRLDDKAPPVEWMFAGPGVAVLATLAITIFAPTARIAWGRLCLMNGIVSLALPLVGIAFTALIGQHMLQQAPAELTDSTSGVQAGLGLAGALVSGALGFVGFFIGAIFLVLAYFLLRTPRVVAVSTTAESTHVGDKNCPSCAEWIKGEAIKCRYCGSDLKVVLA